MFKGGGTKNMKKRQDTIKKIPAELIKNQFELLKIKNIMTEFKNSSHLSSRKQIYYWLREDLVHVKTFPRMQPRGKVKDTKDGKR